MHPLVTVITPGHARLATIERCVVSVQQQTHPNVEHLLLADGSRAFFDVARALADKHEGVDAHFMPPLSPDLSYIPARVARVRNAGVQLARGDLIAYLDDDNTWEPDHLQRLIEVLESDPTLDAAFSYRRLWTEDGQPYTEPLHPWQNSSLAAGARYRELQAHGMYHPGTNLVSDAIETDQAFALCSVDTSAWLMRRGVALAFPFRTQYTAAEMEGRFAEDTDLCMRLHAAGVRAETSGAYTLNYYLGGFSTTASRDWHVEAVRV